MDKRPLPDRQREWLEAESQHWFASGWITPEQKALILDCYQSKTDVSRQKLSRGVFALQAIAMGLVSLAILLLIGFNWQAIPGMMRIALVLGAMLAVHGVGIWLRWSQQKQRASEIAFFLGSFLYGCGIWQIGQVFHINSQNADGIWLWGIGVLPLAVMLESTLLHALVVAIFALWVGQEMLGWNSRNWWWVLSSRCYSLPLLTIPGIVGAYRTNSSRVLALYLPLIAWWLILFPVTWNQQFNPVYLIGTIAALFLAIAETHRVGSKMAVPFRQYGTLGSAIILFLMNFLDMIYDLFRRADLSTNVTVGTVILVVGLGSIAVLSLKRHRGSHETTGLIPSVWEHYWMPVGLVLLYAVLSFWSGLMGLNDTSNTYPYRNSDASSLWSMTLLFPCLLTNIATVALAIWLMKVGLREDRGKPFFGGVVLFLAWAIARYVDLFGGIGGMLGAAIMFLLCGVGLFSLARYWGQRKESPQ